MENFIIDDEALRRVLRLLFFLFFSFSPRTRSVLFNSLFIRIESIIKSVTDETYFSWEKL